MFPQSINRSHVNTACWFTAAVCKGTRTVLQLRWWQNDRVAVCPQVTGTWARLTHSTTNSVFCVCVCSLSKGSKPSVVFGYMTKSKLCYCHRSDQNVHLLGGLLSKGNNSSDHQPSCLPFKHLAFLSSSPVLPPLVCFQKPLPSLSPACRSSRVYNRYHHVEADDLSRRFTSAAAWLIGKERGGTGLPPHWFPVDAWNKHSSSSSIYCCWIYLYFYKSNESMEADNWSNLPFAVAIIPPNVWNCFCPAVTALWLMWQPCFLKSLTFMFCWW